MPHRRRRSAASVLGTLFVVLTAGCAGSSERPSEDAVKESIQRGLTEVYLSDSEKSLYGAESISFEFGEIQFGEPVEKQMGSGELARTVFPVKVRVGITVKYASRDPRAIERGTAPDDVFFFYKDGFDKWQFRTGST